MGDNTRLNANSTEGDLAVTAEVSFGGDTAKAAGVFPGIVSGVEGARSFDLVPGGAGAVTDGTPRATLASDDPAVTGIASVLAKNTEILAELVSILAKLNASIAVTGPLTDTQLRDSAVPISAASLPSHEVTNAGTFAVQAAASGNWPVRLQDGSGNAITSTLVGADQSLDVNLVQSVALTVGTHAVTMATLPDTAAGDLAAMVVDLAALEVLVTAGNASLVDITNLLTTIDADTSKIPSQGQAVMAASLPVVIASNQSAVPVSGTFWQATQPVSHDALTELAAAINASRVDVNLAASGVTLTVDCNSSNVTIDNASIAVTQSGGWTVGLTGDLPDTAAGNFAAMTTDLAALEVLLTDFPNVIGANGDTPTKTLSVAGTRTNGLLQEIHVDASGFVSVNIGNTVTVALAGSGTLPDTAFSDLANIGAYTSRLSEADLDTGAGTDTQAITGLMLAESGGGVLVGSANPLPVSGTFWQATQPVSIAATVQVQSNSANLATQTTAASIDGKITACDTGAIVIASGNLTQLGGQNISMDTGVRDAGTQRVTIATDDVVPASQSGTWNINAVTTVSTVSSVTAIANALPAGDNNIGNVDIASALPAGDNNIGNVDIASALPAGTNAIGKLAANSGVDIGDVDILSIAAGINTIGGVFAASQTDVAYDGTTSRTIERFNVLATADDTEIIPAPGASLYARIRSLNILGIGTTGTTIYFETETTHTALLGTSANPVPIGVDADGDNHGGFFPPFNPDGMFQTADANEAVHIRMPGGAQPMQVWGTYIKVS